jgi:RNA polymerase sigma-70 factor (ECF subfamily)
VSDAFTAERPRLLGLAYRILGSVVDAEDVVQEAWLRWAGADQTTIERPAAWLTTVTTRLALDRLKATRRRREDYVGPWLPEPVLVEPGPEQRAEAAETLTLGFLAALETLDPVARVVFLLTDVFGYASAEVAATVGRSPAACRQLAARSRAKLRSARPHRPSPTDRAVVDRLLAAITSGDTAAAVALLSDDVVLISDGGPLRHAARHPVTGPQRVSRFLCNIAKRLAPGLLIEPAILNGAPGIVVDDPTGQQDAGVAFDVQAGVVSAIWVITAPDKLAGLRRPAKELI